MKHRIRRHIFAAAVVAGVTTLAMSLGVGAAGAEPGARSAEQQLVEELNAGLGPAPDGRQPKAIVDSGSSSGSASRSYASAAIGEGPEMPAYLAAFMHGLAHPDAAPPGANRPNCTPSPAHPRPVVLVHGTWLNAYDTFAYLSPRLARAGYCVYAFNYGRSGLLEGGGIGPIMPGRYGVGPMEDSARQLRDFVEQVRAQTGADRVDLIGHSQGGPVSSHYMKFEDGADKVGKLITFGATHHGTSLMGMATLGRLITNLGINILGFYEPIVGHANIQQAVGSRFYAKLNENGDTVPGVEYTSVGTRHDEISNPYEWTFLTPGPDATVHNITLQDGCAEDWSDHLTIMYSPRAASIALRALDPDANPNLTCAFNPWMIGGASH
ncbi:alpha/beta fold hydrolase [Nocardia amamiensis]|uniref:Alpha/beta fold hydrolase n=1 Tax=Nocardia amamiensis TaxID=404578 RepID=A0ABS0CK65_9NOCA|nr:alpha/beta fold hydrolase [Nocardia amamiensis]MBF6296976.1 alpha/beta fold hydrolase [Nocardia amamiensis]